MLTFLVYLNGEGVKGGCTNFLKDSEGAMDLDRMRDEEGLYRAMDQDILESVQPEEGSCLIFWHPLLHEGQKLEPDSASKFILRSDIMFERDVDTAPEMTTEQREAIEHLKRAGAFEEAGDMDSALREYQQVQRKDPDLL